MVSKYVTHLGCLMIVCSAAITVGVLFGLSRVARMVLAHVCR